jgi:hypothetical protein
MRASLLIRPCRLHEPRAQFGRRAFRPDEQGIKRRAERLPPFGQAVLHLWGHLVVDDARDDAVRLELAQLLDQHFLRHAGNGPIEIGVAPDLPAEELKQDHQLPAPFQYPYGALHALCG